MPVKHYIGTRDYGGSRYHWQSKLEKLHLHGLEASDAVQAKQPVQSRTCPSFLLSAGCQPATWHLWLHSYFGALLRLVSYTSAWLHTIREKKNLSGLQSKMWQSYSCSENPDVPIWHVPKKMQYSSESLFNNPRFQRQKKNSFCHSKHDAHWILAITRNSASGQRSWFKMGRSKANLSSSLSLPAR